MQRITNLEKKIVGQILKDIEYYLNKAKEDIQNKHHPDGQDLCALGLLSYTEFVGYFIESPEKTNYTKGTIPKAYHFNACLSELGASYKNFVATKNQNDQKFLYNQLRCGYVHTGSPRVFLAVLVQHPQKSKVLPGDTQKTSFPADCGIGVSVESSTYYLILETYFQDFKTVCNDLLKKAKTPNFSQKNISAFNDTDSIPTSDSDGML